MALSYTWTDPYTGKPEEIRQRIDLVSKPANLGRGTVLYFRCPSTGRLCRILYRAYHARTFRSRWGFSYRLYYPGQVCGKLDRWNTRYWDVERHLDRTKTKRKAGSYRGKPTKRAERMERLYAELSRTEELRWSPASWPKRIRTSFTRFLQFLKSSVTFPETFPDAPIASNANLAWFADLSCSRT